MIRAAVPAIALLLGAGTSVRAAEYVVPPIMPVPNAWQGRSQAVVRVLDKLDAHVETLTLKVGEPGAYKSLAVIVRACMDRPDGMPADNGAFLDIQDKRAGTQPFSAWSFSGEPAVGVFESPVYGVQLVACQGDLVAPAAPPLPPPMPPPAYMQPPPPDGVAPDNATPGGVPPPDADGSSPGATAPPAETAPPSSTAVDGSGTGDVATPDPVYPDGPPPAAGPPPRPATPPP